MTFFILLHLTVGILCIFHRFSAGAERYWIAVVLMVPFSGSLVYTAAVLLPALLESGNAAGRPAARRKRNARRKMRMMQKEAGPRVPPAPPSRAMETPADLLRHAGALADAGRLAEADAALDALARRPFFADDPDFLFLRANIHERLRRFPEALAALDRYQEVSPASPPGPAFALYALVYEGLGDYDRAEAVYVGAMDRISDDALRCQYGEYLFRRGRTVEAGVVLRQALARADALPPSRRAQEAFWIERARALLERMAP